ncbi:MAG: hypothetical protein GY951_00395, partial [Psychromonas sp.]|nr:hypothetical protein [Psychromonas sp.]
VNKLTKIIAISITFLLIFITTFIIWAWQEMDKPYRINQSYHSIKSEIETNIALSLEQYLGSGDVSMLQQAEKRLSKLTDKPINWINKQQKQSISQSTSALQKAIQQARAAGKLAADPEILLINNEAERGALISDLIILITQSEVSDEIKNEYQKQLLVISLKLQQISILRQRYIQKNQGAVKTKLININSAIEIDLEKISTLPSLAIIKIEEVYEFSFDEPESIDIAVENI